MPTLSPTLDRDSRLPSRAQNLARAFVAEDELFLPSRGRRWCVANETITVTDASGFNLHELAIRRGSRDRYSGANGMSGLPT